MPTTPVTIMLYAKPWELAVWANQHRYPTNPRIPLLKSSEIVSDDLFLTQEELETLDEKALLVVEPYTGDCGRGPTSDDILHFQQPTLAATTAAAFPPKLLPPDTTVACMRIPHTAKEDPDHANDPWIPPHGIRRLVRRCCIDPPAAAKVFMNECVVRHESWIDSRRRQLTIVTANETWAHTGLFGDVTVYKALGPTEMQDWIAKGSPVVTSISLAEKANGCQVVAEEEEGGGGGGGGEPTTAAGCLFQQYAYFQVSPSLKIPFRTRIESSLLNTYQKNTYQGRQLDLEFMILREKHMC